MGLRRELDFKTVSVDELKTSRDYEGKSLAEINDEIKKGKAQKIHSDDQTFSTFILWLKMISIGFIAFILLGILIFCLGVAVKQVISGIPDGQISMIFLIPDFAIASIFAFIGYLFAETKRK